MDWKSLRLAARDRCFNKYDAAEAQRYDQQLGGTLPPEAEAAYRKDLTHTFSFASGMQILDVGAGSGALSKILSQFEDLSITALEPSVAMLDILRSKAELKNVSTVLGGCDRARDRDHFCEGQFHAVVCRQVVNGLFDPLVAFRNWLHWLRPGGVVVIIEGLYGRADWTGIWQEEVDVLPLSSCQTTALIPYLLETVGFDIESVGLMDATNSLPSTRTPRYVVVARKRQTDSQK